MLSGSFKTKIFKVIYILLRFLLFFITNSMDNEMLSVGWNFKVEVKILARKKNLILK